MIHSQTHYPPSSPPSTLSTRSILLFLLPRLRQRRHPTRFGLFASGFLLRAHGVRFFEGGLENMKSFVSEVEGV